MLINSGAVKLQPGASTSITYAVMTKFGIQNPCPDITPLIEMGNAIEGFYEELTPTNETSQENTSIHFQPNPFTSRGELITNGQPLESVRLLNLDGRILREYNHLHSAELTIERDELPSGFYMYSALLSNGQLATGKIIIP